MTWFDIKSAIDITNIYELPDILKENIEAPIIIKNPASSIYYLGIGYIKSLHNHIIDNYAGYNIIFICDVGDDVAYAQAAIKQGFKYILFNGNEFLKIKLQSIADKCNVKIL
jgi:fructose/tagatose bisphosphate aldolase